MGSVSAVLDGLPDMHGLTVAVTGAGGFIGGRLTSALLESTGANVLALVRTPESAARLPGIGHPRLAVAVADLTTPGLPLARGTRANIMVHCAFGNRGTVEQRWRATVDGTATALCLAGQLGVQRFVHVSTMVVYDLDGVQLVSEQSRAVKPGPGDREYAAQKLRAEQLVMAGGSELEFVVVQPTIVYGPGSELWTVRPLARMAAGSPPLPTGATGTCNAVFVDDVVSGVLLAASSRAAAGQRFLVSGPEPVSWGGFFDAYRAMGVKRAGPPTVRESLPEWERQTYESDVVVDDSRARQTLDYRPAFDLSRGMAVTRRWAVKAGFVT